MPFFNENYLEFYLFITINLKTLFKICKNYTEMEDTLIFTVKRRIHVASKKHLKPSVLFLGLRGS
jgi:hypothetical protein